MRAWLVAGGILSGPEGLLLVQNRRKNGSLDWSTPGGVIDEGETVLEGLSREVEEETGLVVGGWSELAYEIEVDFVDARMTLKVEAHVADGWSGALRVDDPDGIVVDMAFTPEGSVAAALDGAPRWVSEPLVGWLDAGVHDTYRYVVTGERPSSWSVRRI